VHRATWPSGIRRRVPGRAYRAASSSSVPAPLGSRTPPTGAVGITAAAPVTLRLRRAVAGDVQHADLVLGDLHRDVRRPGRLRSVHRKRSASAWPARPPRHVRWPRRPIPSTYRRVASRGTPGGMADESPAAVELLGPLLTGRRGVAPGDGSRPRAGRPGRGSGWRKRRAWRRASGFLGVEGVIHALMDSPGPWRRGDPMRGIDARCCRDARLGLAEAVADLSAGGADLSAGGVERPGAGGGGGSHRQVGRGRRPGRAGPGGRGA